MNTMNTRIKIQDVELQLSQPLAVSSRWIGQQEILSQLLACWLVVDAEDLPLTPRLVGKPGIGKTTLAMAGAGVREQELYVYQCTADTRPEDLLVTPVLSDGGSIAYHASPLVTAMIRGGVCVLDEGNRMNEKSWASLAPLLDHRRYVESVVAGILIPAHPDFRSCVTMNNDDSTYEIPDYILSRLQPTLELGPLRLPCGGGKYIRKERLWPYLDDYVDALISFTRREGRTPAVVHGHYADPGQ